MSGPDDGGQSVPSEGAVPSGQGGAEVADVALAPPPEGSGRSRRLGLTAVAGVLVVGALGFAVTTLGSGDGAASPEAAVHALFDAVDAEDAIGVAESLEPSERRIVRAALEEVAATATAAGVADESLDLEGIEGLDLRVDGLAMTTEELAEGVVAVDLQGGTVSSSADLDRLPIGATVREAIDRAEADGETVTDPDLDVIELSGTRLVAVERGGGWHVSVLHSLAEQIRLDGDPVHPYPDPARAFGPVGAASPEAAVREGIDAAVALDLRRLIELTPADEARVLHVYGPLLEDLIAEGDDDRGEGPGVEITDLELEVADAPEGRKVVSATSMTMTWSDETAVWTTAYRDGCTTTSVEYDQAWIDEYWSEVDDGFDDGYDPFQQERFTWCEGDPATYDPFFLPFMAFWSPGTLDVVVEQHDGEWFLSPTRTLFENTFGTLRDLDAEQVRRTVRLWGGEWWLGQPDELWEACGVDAPTLDDSRADAEAAYHACMDSLPEDYEGSWGLFGPGLGAWGSGGFETETEYFGGPESACYEQAEVAADAEGWEGTAWQDAMESCLQELVDAGEVDPFVLADHRCSTVYETEPEATEGPTDDQVDDFYEAAMAERAACMAAAGFDGFDGGFDAYDSGSGSGTLLEEVPPGGRPLPPPVGFGPSGSSGPSASTSSTIVTGD